MSTFDRIEELVRQRRNVILTSTAIILYYLGDADISSFFGNPINDSTVIEPLIWFALLIFTWRYWVHARLFHRAERNEIFSRFGAIEADPPAVKERIFKLAWKLYQEKSDKKFPEDIRNNNKPQIVWDLFGYKAIFRIDPPMEIRIPIFKIGMELYVLREILVRSLSANYLEIWFPYMLALTAMLCALYSDSIRANIGFIFGS